MSIVFVFVVGIAVALARRRLLAAAGDPRWAGDAPARLLGWAVGLLAADRGEWGRAMVGELDRLDGRARRWRFALGCVAAAVVMPPWGRAAAALGALVALAASAAGLALYTHVHYRIHVDGWTWVLGVVLVLILAGYVLGGGALLRRPGVAAPGLVGGLLVAVCWMAVSGFTFDRWVNSLGRQWWLAIAAPLVVGAGATLWGRGAATGRRAARLAAVTAALSVYLYGILAVTVQGAAGHDPSDGWTPAQIVDDNLGNQAVFYLLALPLMTATLGWAAAAATARLRYGRQPRTAPAPPWDPAAAPGAAPALTATRQRRTWYVLVLCAALVASACSVLLAFLSSR